MDIIEILENRYATKVYDSTKHLSEDTIKQLMQVLRLIPSSINSQPWKFFFITKKHLKKKLARISYFNENKIIEAPAIVVFCAMNDIPLFEHWLYKSLPEKAQCYYEQRIRPLSDEQIIEWFARQVYLALGFFLSEVAVLGVDSTPMEGIENDRYDKILNLQGFHTLAAVAIGYRNPLDQNQPSITPKQRRNLTDDVILLD